MRLPARGSGRRCLPRLRPRSAHSRISPRRRHLPAARQGNTARAQPGLSVLRGAGSAHHSGRASVQPAQHRARPVVRFPPQRRSQGHRLLGQRAGRRAPGLVLRGPDLAQRHPLRHRPGGRGTGRHRTRRPAGSSRRVVGRPRREPLRVRRGTLHQRVHRAGPLVAAGLRGVADERHASCRLESALPGQTAGALGHARRAHLRRRHRSDARTHARRRGGRGSRSHWSARPGRCCFVSARNSAS